MILIKIATLSICKNEIDFLPNFLEHNKNADYICILDTGSTDGTWEYLQEQAQLNPKIIIEQKIFEHFKFDETRNYSLHLLPEDVTAFARLDLDEHFYQENWVEILKQKVILDNKKHVYKCRYLDKPLYTFLDSKIIFEAPLIYTKGYNWCWPVHETFIDDSWTSTGVDGEDYCDVPELLIIHEPKESKNRNFYINLLWERYDTILPFKYDIEEEKRFTLELLVIEYCRNHEYEQALEIYERIKDNQFLRILVTSWMYLMTNDVSFLRFSIENMQFYDPTAIYFALRDDNDWCKQHKNKILQEINNHFNIIPEEYKEFDILNNLNKQLAEQL